MPSPPIGPPQVHLGPDLVFHPVSRNPWEVIISGPVQSLSCEGDSYLDASSSSSSLTNSRAASLKLSGASLKLMAGDTGPSEVSSGHRQVVSSMGGKSEW